MVIISYVDEFLYQLNPDIPDREGCEEAWKEYVFASCWYLPRYRWAVEWLVFTPVFLCLGVYWMKKWCRERCEENEGRGEGMVCTEYPITMKVLCLVIYAISIVWRLTKDVRQLFWLGNICQISYLTALLMVFVKNEKWRYVLSRMYCQFAIFQVIAVLTPDLRGLSNFGIFAFFFQHVSAPLIGIYVVLSGRATPGYR